MADRPHFLAVSYSDSGLKTMDYEKKMVREKDVKFDNEDGSLELTDVRLVWYKAPSRWGGMKKFGAVAGAIAGAALLEGVGRQVGGIGGSLMRGASRGLTYAAVGTAISSWTRDSYLNKDKDGNTESLAIPLIAVSHAAQSGDRLIVELTSGGNMEFNFKQKKVIPSVIANITGAQQSGKCPYCGAAASGSATCSNCGGTLGDSQAPASGGASGSATVSRRGDTMTVEGDGMKVQYHMQDLDGDGEPDSVTIDYGGSKGGTDFCKNCGNPLEAGDKFCGKCGQRV